MKRDLKQQRCDLAINTICCSKTRTEQQAKIEKLSYFVFKLREQRKILNRICRRLHQKRKDFYQNKYLHVTLFGLESIGKKDYQTIAREIQLFTKSDNVALKIKLDSIRPGFMYCGNKTLKPLKGLSNETVIAIGDISHNIEFSKYTNSLTNILWMTKIYYRYWAKTLEENFLLFGLH